MKMTTTKMSLEVVTMMMMMRRRRRRWRVMRRTRKKMGMGKEVCRTREEGMIEKQKGL